MTRYSEKIAILTGDPNGIGAEITIKALNELNLASNDVVLISNSEILNKNGKLNKHYEIIEIEYPHKIEFGKITANAGDFAYRAIKKACELRPKFIVTAPTSKEAMHLAGHHYNGQTEILEKFLAHDNQKAEMLFVSKDFRVLLLTRHIPIKDVSETLTKDFIVDKVVRLNEFFKNKLNIQKSQFAICGLNPHCGEHGVIGEEEEKNMIPALNELRNLGINISNPYPADALFSKAVQKYLIKEKLPFDCYIACYHDQGLIPIKTIAGRNTVNMTIGLDIIRTSPSHGTAFDIAGKNLANPDSMIEAIKHCVY